MILKRMHITLLQLYIATRNKVTIAYGRRNGCMKLAPQGSNSSTIDTCDK